MGDTVCFIQILYIIISTVVKNILLVIINHNYYII